MIYESGKKVSLRFNTSESYQIYELCEDYRAIISELKEQEQENF